MNTEMNPVLQRIDELCSRYQWSHYKIAKASDIPLTSFNSMFQRNTAPTIPTLERICEGFQISMKEFFDYESSPYDLLVENQVMEPDSILLLERYKKLSKSNRLRLFSYIDGLEQITAPTILTNLQNAKTPQD